MDLRTFITEKTTFTDFAKALGVPAPLLSQWTATDLTKRRQVPAERCPEIEKATAGAVTCEELRPDIDWAYLRSTGCRRGKKAA